MLNLSYFKKIDKNICIIKINVLILQTELNNICFTF
nr:MAG TPA: hypothetical protein [Caudoviricetes sp.]